MKRAKHGTMRDKVVAVFRAHPDWTSQAIADAVGAESEYVRATLRRNGLKLARRHGMRRIEANSPIQAAA